MPSWKPPENRISLVADLIGTREGVVIRSMQQPTPELAGEHETTFPAEHPLNVPNANRFTVLATAPTPIPRKWQERLQEAGFPKATISLCFDVPC